MQQLTLRQRIAGVLIALVVALLGGVSGAKFGATTVGNDYNATSTRGFDGTALTNLTLLRTGPGTLRSLTVTGANTGVIRFWDATTTNVNLRKGATSTLTFIEFPASMAAGEYGVDWQFSIGLIYELVGGLTPTSTPSWR